MGIGHWPSIGLTPAMPVPSLYWRQALCDAPVAMATLGEGPLVDPAHSTCLHVAPLCSGP